MADTSKVNKRGLELLEGFELTILHAYHGKADRRGVWTIGTGHVITGKEVPTLNPMGLPISEVRVTLSQAEELLQQDLLATRSAINRQVKQEILDKLTDDQYGALVSFVFNIGPVGFKQSKVLENLNNGSISTAGNYFKSFVSVRNEQGVLEKVNGLIRRRAADLALYRSDTDKLQFFLTNSGPTAIDEAKQYIGLGR